MDRDPREKEQDIVIAMGLLVLVVGIAVAFLEMFVR